MKRDTKSPLLKIKRDTKSPLLKIKMQGIDTPRSNYPPIEVNIIKQI